METIDDEESVKVLDTVMGKEIRSVRLNDQRLHLVFRDGTSIAISDHSQNCCEVRYMSTDDDLTYFVGAQLLGVELKEAPNEPSGEEHNVQFLEIKTSRGVFTMANHNEHNGYYGGFYIKAREVEPTPDA